MSKSTFVWWYYHAQTSPHLNAFCWWLVKIQLHDNSASSKNGVTGLGFTPQSETTKNGTKYMKH